MKNLNSVFAAYVIGWAVFFVFYLTIASRTSSLQKEIDRLKDLVNRGK
jgi:CcmD family protein